MFVILGFSGIHFPAMMRGDMNHQRDHFVEAKNNVISKQLPQGKYRCCLEKPCGLCIETREHGEVAACDCLSEVLNGEAPCGECIGEILKGQGNPYLAEYFAKAIAEEVGEQHIDTLKKIVEEKYGMPVEKQI